jgi:sulfur carrier protein ThiS
MRIFLGGHLNFYHPKKAKWLAVDLDGSKPLAVLLDDAGIPLTEVQLVAINGEVLDLQDAVVSEGDEVKVFSAVGGG